MAKVVSPTSVFQQSYGGMDVRIVEWNNIANGDTCAPFDCTAYPDKSIDLHGTYDTGTIAIHGSNHPTTPVYSVLTDAFDTALTALAANEVKVVMQHTALIKPVLTGGGASTDLDITMLLYVKNR